MVLGRQDMAWSKVMAMELERGSIPATPKEWRDALGEELGEACGAGQESPCKACTPLQSSSRASCPVNLPDLYLQACHLCLPWLHTKLRREQQVAPLGRL